MKDKEMNSKPNQTHLVRHWPDEVGQWKLVSTGEIVNAIEVEDFDGNPLFAVIDSEGDGPHFSIDLKNEAFKKIS